MDDDIIVTLKRSNDLLMTFGNDYSDVFLPAIDEIERLREALAFYAEWGIDAPAVDAIIEEDRGDKARAALNIVLSDLEKEKE